MRKQIYRFLRGECGAVTVDWVVITAAVVALTGVAVASLQSASGGLGNNVGTHMSTKTVGP